MGCGSSKVAAAPAASLYAGPPASAKAAPGKENVRKSTAKPDLRRGRSLLGEMDESVIDALEKGTLRLVSTDFLLGCPDGYKLPRLQELEAQPRALLAPQKAADLMRGGERQVLVLSYGWLSMGDPDPQGKRFEAVKEALAWFKANNLLRTGAGLFWDFGSLPQKPRTPAEDATFKEGLRVMANLYASAIGTAVLQLKRIPPCPKEAVGAIRVCRIPSGFATKTALTKAFASVGEVTDVVVRGADEATVVYRTKESAAKALWYNRRTLGLSEDVYLCSEYNDRAYDNRGWCAFENSVSLEFLSRSVKPGNEEMKAIMDAPSMRKMYQIGTPGGAPEPVSPSGPQDKQAVQKRIEAASFIGKADQKLVLDMYKKFQLDGAHAASQFGAGDVAKHNVKARQALAEEMAAKRLQAAQRAR